MGIKSFDSVVNYLKGKAILVANRGIPARRICRSIRERFDAIAVMTATDVDKTAPSASSAHELLLLGPDPRAYLDMHRIVNLAKQRNIIAIHPGWGFASEDDTFPLICKEAGLVFIGSTSESMKLLGNKVQVRNLAESMQVAFDAGAKRILLPMSSVTDIPSVPGELFAKFQTSFYADPVDAVFKALGVE